MYSAVLIVCSILMLVPAGRLFNKVERAEFERRNEHGSETFKDYDDYKKTKSKEGFIEFCATLIVIAAVIVAFIGVYNL